jgi:hypothetical protein
VGDYHRETMCASWYLWNLALKLTRMLPQTLSNMITGNETLITQFWDIQLELSPEQAILPYATGSRAHLKHLATYR